MISAPAHCRSSREPISAWLVHRGSAAAPLLQRPLEIHSSRAVLNREHLFQFSGNASISQGSTRLDADEIQVQFDSGGHILHSILARRSARLTLDPGQEEKSFHQAMGGESIAMRFTSETISLKASWLKIRLFCFP